MKIKLLIKKNLLLFLMCIILCLLIACNSKTIKIGLLIDSSSNVYVNEIIEEIKNNINESYELIIYDAEESQNNQNKQFLSLIDEGADIFIVSLVDRLSANTYVEKCRILNKTIIFFNKEPLKEDIAYYSNAYYVGYNIEKLGLYQSKMVQSLFINPNFLMSTYDFNMNNIIEVVGLKINQGSQTSETMFEMCINDLRQKNFNVKIVATEYISTREEATAKMRRIYNDEKNIDQNGFRNIELILTSNDEIALGVLDFINEIKDQDYYFPFIVISANMIPESIDAIENNIIYASTKSECQLQGQIILDIIESKIKNKNKVMSYYECSEEIESNYCTNYDEHYIYVTGDIVYKDNLNKKIPTN